MRGVRRHPTTLTLVVAIGMVGPAAIQPQGLTGAVIQGTVVSAAGDGVPISSVTLTDCRTGTVRHVRTKSDGSYVLENIPVGECYLLEARAVGFSPAPSRQLSLHVGDRVTRTLVLGGAQAQLLNDLKVHSSDLRDAGAGGPAYSISRDAIKSLPLRDRNFVALFGAVPLATGTDRVSVSGQNARLNSIQVDGGSSNDFFGVNLSPGAGAGGKVISLEALEEIRVLVAPFDVRQGGFSGGLINAVTKSGTNQFRGSVFLSHSRAQLVGRDTANEGAPPFSVLQYGSTFSGPIVRNRVHFFAATELQARNAGFAGASTADATTGVSSATAARAQQIFKDRYGFDPGGGEAPEINEPNRNFFAKLSAQPSRNHWLEISHTRATASTYVFNRRLRNVNDRLGWELSNSGYTSQSNSATTRLRVTSGAGSFTNELIASTGTIRDTRSSRLRTPLFLVQADLPNTYLAGGSEKTAQGTRDSQQIVELTDNISWNQGAHFITAGSQNLLLRVRDNLFLGSWGVWTFASLDALDRRQPSRFEVALPIRDAGALADYKATMLSGYIQDRWAAGARFTATAGLRMDVPFMTSPIRNPALASKAVLHNIDTSVFPSGNGVISPRVGFSWEIGEHRNSMVRGGIGAFASRPPFAWLTNAFVGTGQEQTVVICDKPPGVPAPTTDITSLPRACLGAPAGSSAPPRITYFTSDFRFQQAIKYVLGLDHVISKDLTASFDVIYTRTRNGLFVSDENLRERGVSSEGRVMYGTVSAIDGIAVARPTRLDSAEFGPVYRFGNISGDRSTSVTVAVQKLMQRGAQFQLGYNWSRTEDFMSLSGLNGPIILQTNPLDGIMTKRNLRRSSRDIPQNFVATAIVPLRYGVTASMFYRARSGTPYAYVVNGDANADGSQSDDLAYVPRDTTDLSLVNPGAARLLDAFIEGEPCLRRQRGHVMRRNTCRNPSVQSLDISIARTFRTSGNERFEMRADIFNVANLLRRNWGLVRETSSREDKPFLTISGWDATANRPLYRIPVSNGMVAIGRNEIVVDASRWRAQLGGRYTF